MKVATKAILGTLTALVVGGIGNGVWEYILEPGFRGSASVLLSVATLGVEAFKDDIYLEIAKGFHEKQSVSTANLLALLTVYGVSGSLFLLTRTSKTLVEKVDRTRREIERLEAKIEDGKPQAKSPMNSQERQADLRGRLAVAKAQNLALKSDVRRLHRFTLGAFSLSLALVAWVLVETAKSSYINTAIAHFEQSLAIVSPHATQDELLMLRSRFAQVTNRDDFVAVLSEIDRIGDRGGLELAGFEAW
jgi:hypothetical protein